MDNKKKQLMIVSCLIAAFILISINSAKTIIDKNKSKAYAAAEKAVQIPAAVTPKAVIPKAEQAEQQNFEGPIYRDPFKRQASAGPMIQDSKKLKRISSVAGALVTGILYDKEHPANNYCIVNGEVLKVNESVDDFTIIDIKEDSVILKDNKESKEYKLKLWEEETGSL
jgi:hypothetical protein